MLKFNTDLDTKLRHPGYKKGNGSLSAEGILCQSYSRTMFATFFPNSCINLRDHLRAPAGWWNNPFAPNVSHGEFNYW